MKRILFFLFSLSVIEMATANPVTEKQSKPLVLQKIEQCLSFIKP